MTQTDKEKLRMAKNLVKANNKKIKGLVKDIDSFLVEKGGDDVIENWDGQTPRDLLTQVRLCLVDEFHEQDLLNEKLAEMLDDLK